MPPAASRRMRVYFPNCFGSCSSAPPVGGAGLFVIAAAQSGHHEDGRTTYGHSLVIDPWGEVLLDMGDGAGVKVAEIDLKRITDVRSRVPAIIHRRPIEAAVAR